MPGLGQDGSVPEAVCSHTLLTCNTSLGKTSTELRAHQRDKHMVGVKAAAAASPIPTQSGVQGTLTRSAMVKLCSVQLTQRDQVAVVL